MKHRNVTKTVRKYEPIYRSSVERLFRDHRPTAILHQQCGGGRRVIKKKLGST